MMWVSENSSISIDMISWFDFTSLHSMAKETHLSVSSSPSLSVTPLVIFTQVNRNSTAASSVPALKLKKTKNCRVNRLNTTTFTENPIKNI
jgi:hypothetical protein